MSFSGRLLKHFVAAFAALAAAPAQPAIAPLTDGGQVIHIVSPRFVATAVKFKAIDETGWDWLGSDEVHAVFADFNPVDERATSVYGDVDSGETKTFRDADRCIAPQPNCDHGTSSLHFAVALWEADWTISGDLLGLDKPTLAHSHEMYEHGIDSGDDLIGRAEIDLSQVQLVSMLPAVGSFADTTVKPTGGSGSYEFTYRITRLQDVERTIVIHVPTDFGISLQASLDNPPSAGHVRLTWSGATAASVDILRGVALIVTTANDGEYIDHVSTGTYEYRVCNGGSTTCSAIATITVP
jgi:hypothetical protein